MNMQAIRSGISPKKDVERTKANHQQLILCLLHVTVEKKI